jgi:hypothetical protein
MLQSILNRTKTELIREKQKDYRNVVVVQIIIIVLGLTLSEFVLRGSQTPEGKLVITIFSLFGAIYTFMLWDLLRNFTANKIILISCLVTLIAVIIASVGEFPYYKIFTVSDRQLYLLIIHGLLFPVEVTVIGFAIRDIFSGEFLTPDKLWGSACVFLMIGISFASLYDLICIVNPQGLGESLEMGLANYSACVFHSFSVLGGMDPNHPHAIRLIRNISVIEAVWGNLFVVLIIGKLMGLPRPPKAESKN